MIAVWVLVSGCSKSDNNIEHKSGLLRQSWATDFQESPISRILDVATDSDGRVYVPDQKAGVVYRLDNQGKILDTFGRTGEGPGEFIFGPWEVEVSDTGTIFVLDKQGFAIHKFDNDLEYNSTSSFLGGAAIHDMTTNANDELIVVYSTPASGGHIGIVKGDSLIELTALRRERESGVFWSSAMVDTFSDGAIVVAYNFVNAVELYSKDGAFIRGFLVDNEELRAMPFPQDGIPSTVSQEIRDNPPPKYPLISDMTVDDTGHIYILMGRGVDGQSANHNLEVRVFDSDGVDVSTFTLNDRSAFLEIDSTNDKLYASRSAATELVVYDID